MINFIVYHYDSGEIIRSGQCQEGDLEIQAGPREFSIEGIGSYQTHYFCNGGIGTYSQVEFQLKLQRPIFPAIWINASMSWRDLRTLQEIKDITNDKISSARLLANISGFTYEGKIFATDQLSRGDIDGINGYVGLYNALPPNWAGAWKAIDNSYLPIPDLDAWKSFYSAMVAAGNANFAKAQQLKAQLAAAATPEEVEAVVW